MLASDLAPLFGVAPKRLNECVRRNERRFPEDFGFRLTRAELANLRPQIAASSSGHGGHRHPPFVVTEYGVVMLANIVDSESAIAMSVRVVRGRRFKPRVAQTDRIRSGVGLTPG